MSEESCDARTWLKGTARALGWDTEEQVTRCCDFINDHIDLETFREWLGYCQEEETEQ